VATQKKPRDTWDKLAVVASLMVPLSVAAVGFMGTQYLHKQQEAETKARLYIQLQTSREKADADLRKSMFDTVISTFLRPRSQDPAELVLALELLAYNFHEVIDLGPLFKHVESMISRDRQRSNDQHRQFFKRLERAAVEVTDKQLAALKDASTIFYDDVFFDDLEQYPEGIRLFRQNRDNSDDRGIIQLAQTPAARTFAQLDILGVDQSHKELRARLWVYHIPVTSVQPDKEAAPVTEVDIIFKVGFYDFPMIDNTRLANGRRITVVMRAWEPGRADVALAYFPGSRASLKEKPYYDELVQQLQNEQATVN